VALLAEPDRIVLRRPATGWASLTPTELATLATSRLATELRRG
jgi:hypothetical protein